MIGSISKVRPCGHSHVYKYAHAKNSNDINTVEFNHLEDHDGFGNWHFKMDNLVTLGDAFTGVKNVTNITATFPSLTNAVWGRMHGNQRVINYDLDMPVCTSANCLMYGTANVIGNLTIRLPEATEISHLTYENDVRGEYNLYAPKARNCNYLIEWGWSPTANIMDLINIDLPNAEQVKGYWWKSYVTHISHDVDEDGNFTMASGNLKVDRKYTTFPKLKNGDMMFYNCTLSKNYSNAFLNDLPDWSDDTSNHPLLMGIHIDHKYDPELQTELMKVGNNYTPTINVSGGPTTNKNWQLTVNWNGTSNGYAVPKEEVTVSNDYELPENYTKLKYLDSTSTASSGYGKAYIKTGIIPTSQTGFYVEAMVANNNGYVFGCHNSSGNGMGIDLNNWSANGLQDSPPGIFYGTRSYVTNTTNFPIHNIFSVMHMNYKNNKYAFLKMGDAQWHKDLEEFNYDISSQVFLFGLCAGNGNLSEGLRGKIYRAQITEGEEVVRDFVPCLDADSVPCMRDLINGVDYYNEGSGQFTYEIESS